MKWSGLIPDYEQLRLVRRDVVRRILACADGDAALLYLFLCEEADQPEAKICQALHFSAEQYEKAAHTLVGIVTDAPAPSAPPLPEKAVYSIREMRLAITGDPAFAAVCDAAEQAFGRPLTESQLRLLYHAYEGLHLPGDVLIDLLAYVRSRGPVSRKALEQEVTLWADRGIFDADAAAAYLQETEVMRPRCQAMAAVLRREEESLQPKERAQLERFVRMGFDEAALALALGRMEKAGQPFSWRYLCGILKDWQQKGLFTTAQILAAEPETEEKKTSRGKTPAEKTFLTQKPPEGELTEWEKQWLRQVEEYKKRRESK